MSDLESFLGLNINKICDNGFDDPKLNHCAHFVSHAMGYRFPYNCKLATGGTGMAANLRVHELFAQCAEVGEWPAPGGPGDTLMFVTAHKNVDLKSKTMMNTPRKHVGVFSGGFVYNYSNTRDSVVKQTVADFQKTFDNAYGGPQGYFWGRMSAKPTIHAIAALAASTDKAIEFGRQDEANGDIYGVLGDEKFYVGTPTTQFRGGLYQRAQLLAATPTYKAADHKKTLGQWAELLELTGFCESKNKFICINTYDRAAFTFGFYQLAAHTPGDNLILFMRKLPSLSAAGRYAPQLQLRSGKLVWEKADGGEMDLEATAKVGKETQNVALMQFLNPTQPAIDDAEFDWSARLIHWTLNDSAMRQLQVDQSAAILQHKVSTRYDRSYGLDGESDVIIAVIADIHHNGRANKDAVKAALAKKKAPDRLNALIDINPKHADRQATLRKKLDAMIAAGRLGQHTWVTAMNEFVAKDK